MLVLVSIEYFLFVLYDIIGQVSMAEVDHWMWRLFLDDLGDACASVGIQNVPFLSSCLEPEVPGQAALPLPTPLLYGISPSLLQQQAFWPKRFVKLVYIVNISSLLL